eukprot:g3803.t1
MSRNFGPAFFGSFLAILASEIGDKTFFIAAILAMKHPRLQVFLGAFLALAFMHALSAFVGSIAYEFIPIKLTYCTSILLFLVTGLTSLREAFCPPSNEVDDMVVITDDSNSTKSKNGHFANSVTVRAFVMTFVAEWGDRSQFVTVGLGAVQNVSGVVLGGFLGHLLCTGAAVLGGKKIATHVNEQLISGIGGVLFLLFGLVDWNATEFSVVGIEEYLAEGSSSATGGGGGSSANCLSSSETSPRSSIEFARTISSNSPSIFPPLITTPTMNKRNGGSYSFRNPVIDSDRTSNGDSTKTSSESKEVPICFDFVQGKCRRPNCRYQHDFGAVIRHNSKESRICFDHLRGECTRGSLCRFSHDLQPLIMQSLEDAARQVVEPRANGICYDFCRGACPRRGTCPWTHNLIEIAWSTAKKPLNDHHKIAILRKVLEVVLASCPHLVSEMDTLQILQQTITQSQQDSTISLRPSPPPPPPPYQSSTLGAGVQETMNSIFSPLGGGGGSGDYSSGAFNVRRRQFNSRMRDPVSSMMTQSSSRGGGVHHYTMNDDDNSNTLVEDINLQSIECNLSKAFDFNF